MSVACPLAPPEGSDHPGGQKKRVSGFSFGWKIVQAYGGSSRLRWGDNIDDPSLLSSYQDSYQNPLHTDRHKKDKD
jgi:hypothetical protein